VREAYSAYRTNWDVVKHYQSEVLPLRSRMSEENVYRYNGMLIGTLALLEDARAQVAVVQSALKAQTQFWLAEAALQTSLISNPSGAVSVGAAMASSASSAGGH
jgi:outer membrane protein TolC